MDQIFNNLKIEIYFVYTNIVCIFVKNCYEKSKAKMWMWEHAKP